MRCLGKQSLISRVASSGSPEAWTPFWIAAFVGFPVRPNPAHEGPEQVIARYRDGQPVHQGVGYPDRHVQRGREGQGAAGARGDVFRPDWRS